MQRGKWYLLSTFNKKDNHKWLFGTIVVKSKNIVGIAVCVRIHIYYNEFHL